MRLVWLRLDLRLVWLRVGFRRLHCAVGMYSALCHRRDPAKIPASNSDGRNRAEKRYKLYDRLCIHAVPAVREQAQSQSQTIILCAPRIVSQGEHARRAYVPKSQKARTLAPARVLALPGA